MTTPICPFEAAATRLAADDVECSPDACFGCQAPDPFEMLSGCHRHLLQACEALDGIARTFEAGRPLDDERLARLGEIVVLLDVAVPLHIADEERTLFPLLQGRDPAGAGPTMTMHRDHEQHEQLGYALRSAILHRDPRAIARTARALTREYRRHIELEEDLLLPRARKLVPDAAARRFMVEEMIERRRRCGVVGC